VKYAWNPGPKQLDTHSPQSFDATNHRAVFAVSKRTRGVLQTCILDTKPRQSFGFHRKLSKTTRERTEFKGGEPAMANSLKQHRTAGRLSSPLSQDAQYHALVYAFPNETGREERRWVLDDRPETHRKL
jgi:hypothetical protein